jgi:hypothetical protein
VTHSQWLLDERNVATQGPGMGTSGSDSRTFVFDEPGDVDVSFRVWHQTQSAREASETFTIEVSACDDDCPAAPTLANAYLNYIGYSGERGALISAVATAIVAGEFGTDNLWPLVRGGRDGVRGRLAGRLNRSLRRGRRKTVAGRESPGWNLRRTEQRRRYRPRGARRCVFLG